MSTNITVFPVDKPVVIYFQDGSTMTVQPQDTKQFQLIDHGFCTISEGADPDESEHMPPPEKVKDAFAAFWHFIGQLVEEAKEPEVNPL